MTHILSSSNRSEFLAIPQLVRFDMPHGERGPEPTLLVKTLTLTLKYLVRLRTFRIVICVFGGNHIGYGIQIDDDPEHKPIIWSIVETESELNALNVLLEQPTCMVFLFNELAVNVAWSKFDIVIRDQRAVQVIKNGSICKTPEAYSDDMNARLESIQGGVSAVPNAFVLDVPLISEWHEVRSTYITNRATRSDMSIFSLDEGGQQEELAIWLVDTLMLSGAVRSPQIQEPSGRRELSDVFLSYENGSFLLESKVLSIMERDVLPDRAKLKRNTLGKLDRAISQLKGGLKNLQRGYKVFDSKGNELIVQREKPSHAIEPPRELRRLQTLRKWSHEQIKPIFP